MAGSRRDRGDAELTAAAVSERVLGAGDSAKAVFLRRFFKTGPGEYGEGDEFAGLTVPMSRSIAREFHELPLTEVVKLLSDPVHEVRLVALLILVRQFQRGDAKMREKIFRTYLRNARRVNNWDLVDSSAPYIVGAYLFESDGDLAVLRKLARSRDLWERRIAMLSTFWFTRNGNVKPALEIAEILVDDEHDLIHKAVGWMLREVGIRDLAAEEKFLARHHRTMPRTMLRYAIEKFPQAKRKTYMAK